MRNYLSIVVTIFAVAVVGMAQLGCASTPSPSPQEPPSENEVVEVAPAEDLEEVNDSREVEEDSATEEEHAVLGHLDREIIQRVVRSNRDAIRTCYESALQRAPELAGRVMMQWVISATGEVVTATVQETTLNSREVENCLAEEIRSWNFPEPDGGGIVRVNYPFNFSS